MAEIKQRSACTPKMEEVRCGLFVEQPCENERPRKMVPAAKAFLSKRAFQKNSLQHPSLALRVLLDLGANETRPRALRARPVVRGCVRRGGLGLGARARGLVLPQEVKNTVFRPSHEKFPSVV